MRKLSKTQNVLLETLKSESDSGNPWVTVYPYERRTAEALKRLGLVELDSFTLPLGDRMMLAKVLRRSEEKETS